MLLRVQAGVGCHRGALAQDLGTRQLGQHDTDQGFAHAADADQQGALGAQLRIGVIVSAMAWSTASSWGEVLDRRLGQRQRPRDQGGLRGASSSENLRAYLKKLPDFEDVEAEDWAMRHALSFRNFSAALYFFHEWPNPAHAAQLVLDRASEIDDNAYYLLDPVARQIEGKHPLAPTLLRGP